jgi:hypothetical protein
MISIVSKGEARLIRVNISDNTWHKKTIIYLNIFIVLLKEFIEIYRG